MFNLLLIFALTLCLQLSVYANTLCSPYDNLQQAVLDYLDTAQEQVLMAGYTINNPVIIDKLIELHDRLVDVEVITDTTQASGKNETIAINKLRRHSVPVFVGRSRDDQLMHAKFIVIDGFSSEDGSYNFTISANHQDNVIHINHNLEEAQQLKDFWLQIKRDLR